MTTQSPILHRDDPDRDALPGHTRVTREDWLRMARDTLIRDGVDQVKILTLAERMEVSRSSFYWYFGNRQDLLTQLLADWERGNTGILIAHAELPADTIVDAVNNFFRCIVEPGGFNHRLDFAVREWARRDDGVRRVIDRSDTARTEAIAAMFRRHGYAQDEADIRARVLYYQQIGYYALELNETLDQRLSRVAGYLHCFTGVQPTDAQVRDFVDYARSVGR